MAGSLALVLSEPQEKSVSNIKEEWQKVSYSRFITYPSLPSTHPSLIPFSNSCRYKGTRGTWLSSHSPTASLQIRNYKSISHAVLTVCLHGNILEEHYVSKLHFTWPLVSCLSGYPPRGSRSLFVSYKDSLGQDILKDSTETEPLNSDIRSEISLESKFMSADGIPSRACEEESSVMTPVQTSSFETQFPLSLNYEVEQDSQTEKTLPSRNHEDISSALPPSFASFLSNCCSEVQQVAAQPTSFEDVDLKSQIARYMEDSSFQEMLIKVEKVISEIGDDLLL
ncbi:protein POOR HOMOLOGOUS SYNAPSIS 1 isoform X2 [Ricinus communis]|uniref:protein POOR HOMOLOGOUS SYNAPSIS 1 isoform X2 n=1 Tax=Ricinus communis TaxID=3988 RepID=UPI000D698628|nr:protein POOR HOMOLOGOUS SYNAPSIS 1 isoform X2 [Ricinus communis]|eukprot:XP_025014687.1 protein POOR HOMOLOGOUS SYNAPSIS 1 isoform X2 [Ricinus communis]